MRKPEKSPRIEISTIDSLTEDIKYLEARLKEMGYNGDCAYERAMTKAFEQLVTEKRQTLASLDCHLPA